jgi:hypothetical protein
LAATGFMFYIRAVITALLDRINPRAFLVIGIVFLILTIGAFIQDWSFGEHSADPGPDEPSLCWPHGCNG